MRLLKRLAYWLRRSEDAGDLSDEMAFHREESRAVWLWPSLEAVWQDARHTVRALRRTPTFAIGVTLTLALGIGANAAMFSLVDRRLFRPPR